MSQTDTAGNGNDSEDSIPNTIDNYKDLFRAFIHGATSGEHRRLRIEQDGGRTLLVAYNKWVYAEREQGSGLVTFYSAWASHDIDSNASRLQAGRFRQELDAMSLFHQVALQERVENTLIDVEGNEYSDFSVTATP